MKKKILLCALSFFAVALFSCGIAFLPNWNPSPTTPPSDIGQEEVDIGETTDAANGNIGIRVYHNVYYNGVTTGTTGVYTNGYELDFLGYISFRAGIDNKLNWVTMSSYSDDSTSENTKTGGNSNTWNRSAKLQMSYQYQASTSNAKLVDAYYVKTSTSTYPSNSKTGGTEYTSSALQVAEGIDLGLKPNGSTVYITIIVSWLGQPQDFEINYMQSLTQTYTLSTTLNYGAPLHYLAFDGDTFGGNWASEYDMFELVMAIVHAGNPDFCFTLSTSSPMFDGYFDGQYSHTYYFKQDSPGSAFRSQVSEYMTGNLSLYANYPEFTMTFDKNGGSGGTNSIQVMYLTFLENEIDVPTRTGYTFAGYTYQGELIYDASGKAIEKDSYSILKGYYWDKTAKDTTLVAQWNAIPSTLTVNPNGGSYSGSTSITKGYGSTQAISSPSRTGYSLGAWVLDGGGSISTFGKLHDSYTDPFFMDNNNSTSEYNNEYNGTVTHEYIAASNTDIELPTGARILRIKNTGSASPGLGGFTNHLQSYPNALFYTIIYAKIPKGYSIRFASNATGTNSTRTWLTSQVGTGDWQVYIHKIQCGSSGELSTTNFYYIDGGANGTASNPIVWDVAYFGTYDATGLSVSGDSTSSLTYTYDDSNNSLVALWSCGIGQA